MSTEFKGTECALKISHTRHGRLSNFERVAQQLCGDNRLGVVLADHAERLPNISMLDTLDLFQYLQADPDFFIFATPDQVGQLTTTIARALATENKQADLNMLEELDLKCHLDLDLYEVLGSSIQATHDSETYTLRLARAANRDLNLAFG